MSQVVFRPFHNLMTLDLVEIGKKKKNFKLMKAPMIHTVTSHVVAVQDKKRSIRAL